MTKLTLISIAVLCAMPTGYRRAGFALAKGENELEVTQEQLTQLNEDSNVSVQVKDPLSLDDTLTDLAGVGERTFGFDCCTAPEELHPFIAAIDDLNKKAPLTKKPNCDHLTITVDDKPLTPTAAERDAAWAWYQENVVIASTNETEA